MAARPNICLKKISAVPQTGGRHMSGHLTVFGLESYTFHPWNSRKNIAGSFVCFYAYKYLSDRYEATLQLWRKSMIKGGETGENGDQDSKRTVMRNGTLAPSTSTTIFLSGTELRKLRYSWERDSSLEYEDIFCFRLTTPGRYAAPCYRRSTTVAFFFEEGGRLIMIIQVA